MHHIISRHNACDPTWFTAVLLCPCPPVLLLLPLQAVTDETLKKLESSYLRDLKLQGVERIQKVRPCRETGAHGPCFVSSPTPSGPGVCVVHVMRSFLPNPASGWATSH
jgi:hypothetical protein